MHTPLGIILKAIILILHGLEGMSVNHACVDSHHTSVV